jgi:hypothetical protein
MTHLLRILSLGALLASVHSVAGCSCDGPRVATQVVVIVEADAFVRAQADLLRVEVFGGPAEPAPAFPEEEKETLMFSVARDEGWPRTLALAPENRDPTRIYRVVATATRGGEVVAVARVISGYVAGDVRTVRVYLTTVCAPAVCTELQTCDEISEMCRSAEVDPEELPPYRPDAGAMDAGSLDASSPRDGGVGDGGDGGTTCECDDGIACTTDACDAEGVCRSTPTDALCDDLNPCTADVCGGTGCSNTATPTVDCDDGVFCNGADTCDAAGVCGHAGDPCDVGTLTCDEDADVCDGMCTGDGGCPPDSTSAWTSCVYAEGCAENGTRMRELHEWACELGACVESVTSETDAGGCSRPTAGDPCGSECDAFGACIVSGGPCATDGMAFRACRTLACNAGTCGIAGTSTDSTVCSGPPTDGLSCGGCFTCSSGACTNGAACDSGTLPDPDGGSPPDTGIIDSGIIVTARDGGGAVIFDGSIIE